MDKKNSIIIIIILSIYTLVNLIGYNNIPSNVIVLVSIICALGIIICVLKYDYFRTHSKFISGFFISVAIGVSLVALDIVLKGRASFYTERVSDYVYYVITALFFGGVFMGLIGVVKDKMKK
ncbi:hypothetical protein [Clostridium sp. 'White wine YQ']|uniref:hypothetical protein n=1 Tax=Clostridium sp. 'White wine YQ' TaxID=3027474 RepID=UPI002366A355|nr:hypothetical protein [Clostridium sp. 'White wine YQ']MDD7793063.1 hypothetical protein [Clostridium sp. 'White wine YQ']